MIQEKQQPLLSICIPTYNRAKYLPQLLDSIMMQATDDVEIVISDNASVDNTFEIVEAAKKKFQHITYFCWDKNMGADKNYLKTVALAKGQYCWLMGSDDVVPDGVLEYILPLINNNKEDIYLFNRTCCDIAMNFITNQQWLQSNTSDNILFEFIKGKDQSYINYFSKATSLCAVFSYLSSIIVKKERWDLYCNDKNVFIAPAYSHVYILLSIICNNATLLYINKPLIKTRCGNDSFLNEGLVARFLLDINGYLNLGKHFFPNYPAILHSFLKILTIEHPSITELMKIRFLSNSEKWNIIKKYLIECGFNPNKVAIAGYLGSKKILMNILLLINKGIKKLLYEK